MKERIFLAFLFHCVGDYTLQGEFIAMNKGTGSGHALWLLFVHSSLYTLPFALQSTYSFPELMVILISHFLIDMCKCRSLIGLAIDQSLHLAILIVMTLMQGQAAPIFRLFL